MSQIPPMIPLVMSQGFDDFEEFAEAARGWKLDFLQLDRGGFQASFSHLMTPNVVLSRVEMGRKVLQHGEPPAGFRTFAYAAGEHLDLKWRGKTFGQEGLMLFPAGDGLESVSQPGFNVYVLSVSEWLLEGLAEARGLDSIDDLFPAGDLLRQVDSTRRELQNLSCRLLQAGVADPTLVSDWAFRAQLERELVGGLLDCLGKGECRSTGPRMTRSRRQALERAVEVMRERAGEPVSVGEVETLTGMSSRTLRYAFREAFGMSPKQYLSSVRFNRVRADLLSGRARSVTDAAKEWGFWHMGQFAKDYQILFGEKPSDTLAG